jgi:hypothetical protein
VAVRLRFSLPSTGRLFLVVRGPIPSCRVVGIVPLHARRGLNVVDFTGRVDGRFLRPGAYALSISATRQATAAGPVALVEVVSKRRTVPAEPGADAPDCTAARGFAASPFYGLASRERSVSVRERAGLGAAPTPTAQAIGRRELPSLPAQGDQQHDVLGIAIPGLPGHGGTLSTIVSIGILTVIGALLLTAATLVTRFLRGSWNP